MFASDNGSVISFVVSVHYWMVRRGAPPPLVPGFAVAEASIKNGKLRTRSGQTIALEHLQQLPPVRFRGVELRGQKLDFAWVIARAPTPATSICPSRIEEALIQAYFSLSCWIASVQFFIASLNESGPHCCAV
jgi:hypothetical protein